MRKSLLLVLICWALAAPAFCCSCGWVGPTGWVDPPPLTRSEAKKSLAIFSGLVTSVEIVDVPLEDGLSTIAFKAELAVAKVWRGQRSKQLAVFSTTGCSFLLEEGRSYLVFASRLEKSYRTRLELPRSTLETDQCTRSTGVPQEMIRLERALNELLPAWSP